jgi:CRISPR-associated protein Csn2
MRLVNPEYNIELNLLENQVQILVIENPTMMQKISSDLWNQVNGETGEFILSEAEKIYPISKKVNFIMNPFALNCNDRKIISKLYQELSGLAEEEYYEKTAQLNGELVRYIDMLTSSLPYHLKFDLDLDVVGLLKNFDVEIASSADTMLEHVIEYIRLMHQMCHVEVFATMNIKQYFSEKEIQGLYEFAFYEKINLLLIENSFSKKKECEKILIFDKELCKIKLD